MPSLHVPRVYLPCGLAARPPANLIRKCASHARCFRYAAQCALYPDGFGRRTSLSTRSARQTRRDITRIVLLRSASVAPVTFPAGCVAPLRCGGRGAGGKPAGAPSSSAARPLPALYCMSSLRSDRRAVSAPSSRFGPAARASAARCSARSARLSWPPAAARFGASHSCRRSSPAWGVCCPAPPAGLLRRPRGGCPPCRPRSAGRARSLPWAGQLRFGVRSVPPPLRGGRARARTRSRSGHLR